MHVRLLDATVSDVLILIAASAFYGLWSMWDFFFDDHNNTSEVIGTNALICLVILLTLLFKAPCERREKNPENGASPA